MVWYWYHVQAQVMRANRFRLKNSSFILATGSITLSPTAPSPLGTSWQQGALELPLLLLEQHNRPLVHIHLRR